jgi:hypothetical protein
MARDFLMGWYGEAPRQIVSIKPDGPIFSKCLWPQQPADEAQWIREQVKSGRNCYFHVNQPGWALDKRAEKKDVRTVRAFHVDVDPSPGEEPGACKERAVALFRAFAPPASVVVDSGGGLQGFWLLDEPVTLDGTPEKWEAVERFNIAIQVAFGADSCFNVDRIMRLPGTINFPNKKKVAKGRAVAPAFVLPELTTWARHPLSAFTQAPPVRQAGAGSGASRRGRVTVPGNLQRFASTDDLPVKLPDYTVMLIVNGTDTENPTRYPSRSEVLWRVCCDMVRAGADDETIASVLLDPDFKISSSVLDKARPERYAAEQIAGAREEAINPALREINAHHAVIESDPGGRCTVMEECYDGILKRWYPVYQSFDAFKNRYSNQRVSVTTSTGGSKSVPLGAWWLMQEERRQFNKVVFWPNADVPADQFNLWRGFAVKPLVGSKHENYLALLQTVVCDNNYEAYRYLIRWMARAVQLPDKPGEVAVVLRGKKGTGKSFTVQAFGRLFGQHFIQVNSPKMVVGDFNAHYRDCVVLFADEAFHAGDKLHEGALKGLITEPTRVIEAKGVNAEVAPNFIHVMMASNDEWVVPASADERRFFVMNVSDERLQDTAYFASLRRELEDGGFENLLHYLQNLDLGDFEVRAVPSTPGLDQQKIASLPPEAQAILELLNEAVLPNNAEAAANIAATNDQDRAEGAPGLMGLRTDARNRVPAMRFVSDRRYAQCLRSIGCEGVRLSRYGNRAGWRFPPLNEARARFERSFGNVTWSNDAQEWYPATAIGRDPL